MDMKLFLEQKRPFLISTLKKNQCEKIIIISEDKNLQTLIKMHNRNFFYLAAWLIILEIFGSVADNLLTHYNFSLKKELCRENSLSNARVLDISILKVFRQSIFEHFETWNFLVCTYYLSGEFSVRQAQREVVNIKNPNSVK